MQQSGDVMPLGNILGCWQGGNVETISVVETLRYCHAGDKSTMYYSSCAQVCVWTNSKIVKSQRQIALALYISRYKAK